MRAVSGEHKRARHGARKKIDSDGMRSRSCGPHVLSRKIYEKNQFDFSCVRGSITCNVTVHVHVL